MHWIVEISFNINYFFLSIAVWIIQLHIGLIIDSDNVPFLIVRYTTNKVKSIEMVCSCKGDSTIYSRK